MHEILRLAGSTLQPRLTSLPVALGATGHRVSTSRYICDNLLRLCSSAVFRALVKTNIEWSAEKLSSFTMNAEDATIQ